MAPLVLCNVRACWVTWMAAVIVDPDPSLDAHDRSFPAFWLPFQDVTAQNHSAQWVATVQTPPEVDGGTEEAGAGEGDLRRAERRVLGVGPLLFGRSLLRGALRVYVQRAVTDASATGSRRRSGDAWRPGHGAIFATAPIASIR
jgi:hypothetical protein